MVPNSCAYHHRYRGPCHKQWEPGSPPPAKYPCFKYLHHPKQFYDTTLTPDIGNILYCSSKAFAEYGDHSGYYLNMLVEFKQWVKDRARPKPRRLRLW